MIDIDLASIGRNVETREFDPSAQIFPPERSRHRAARLAALAGMLTDPRWRDAIATSRGDDLLAMFSTGRGDIVRVSSAKPRVAQLEFAVELALYGMFQVGRHQPA